MIQREVKQDKEGKMSLEMGSGIVILYRIVYTSAKAAVTRYHRLGGFNKHIFTQFWRLEVQDQSAGGVGSPEMRR